MQASPMTGWERDLERWREPFVAGLRRAEQRRWAPVHLKGLILPGDVQQLRP
jgi:hypothetical protein